MGTAVQVADAVSFAAFFALVPVLACGQTLAQKLLSCIVRTDAAPARWNSTSHVGLLALELGAVSLLFALDLDGTGRR
ncbi:MAG: hypothetical protein ACLR3C_03395 [Eggerthella lenta]